MKVYKIPADDYNSYLVLEEGENPILFHSGNVTPLYAVRENLMGGSQILTTEQGLKFIVPSDKINYSYPPSLLNGTTIVVRESNPTTIKVVLQAVKMHDPDAITFEPSPNFRGSRSGYVFKTGDRGTGYYLDNRSLLKAAGQEDALVPSSEDTCEGGVCSLDDDPVEKAGRMFQAAPSKQVGWSAAGEPIYEDHPNPVGDTGEKRAAILYQQQMRKNEMSMGPDSLPMAFQ